MTEQKPAPAIGRVIPDLDPTKRCPDHPNAEPLDGYGLAGGGLGIYTCCSACGRVLSKTEDPFDVARPISSSNGGHMSNCTMHTITNSSNVKAIGHDGHGIVVHFHNGGQYHYAGAPASLVDEVTKLDKNGGGSPGGHVVKNIVQKFKATRLS